MMPNYHPSESLTLEWAAGTLSSGRALIMATHLDVCASCRHDAARAESIGGALLSDLTGTAMKSDALALALARIERPVAEAPAGAAKIQPADWIIVPQAVSQAVSRGRPWKAPGVWMAPIRGDGSSERTYLLGMSPGIQVPLHTHKGAELVCVLKGAFADGDHIYRPGDVCESDESVEHRPGVAGDAECVCLVASDHALIARDWVGRLFQPFIGI